MRFVPALILLAVVAGCSKKAEPSPPPPAALGLVESAAGAQASAPRPAPEPEPPELPTEGDFEQEATEKITGSNLERELDQLERELLGR